MDIFQDFLAEVSFSKAVEWEWTIEKNYLMRATFYVEGKRVDLDIGGSGGGKFLASFSTDKMFRNADFKDSSSVFEVLSTVASVLIEFVEKRKPTRIGFSASKDLFVQKSRADVYRRMIEKFLPDGYDFEEVSEETNTKFVIYKK